MQGMEKFAARFTLLAFAIFVLIVHCKAGKNYLGTFIKSNWMKCLIYLIASQIWKMVFFHDIACKDNYPKNYWKKCSVSCAKLKARGACRKKWNQALTGNCKRVVPAWHRNRYVNQYCKKSCGGCSKKAVIFIIHS